MAPKGDECEACDFMVLPCTLIQGALLIYGPRLLLIITKPRLLAGLLLVRMIKRQHPAEKIEEKYFKLLFLDLSHSLAKLIKLKYLSTSHTQCRAFCFRQMGEHGSGKACVLYTR